MNKTTFSLILIISVVAIILPGFLNTMEGNVIHGMYSNRIATFLLLLGSGNKMVEIGIRQFLYKSFYSLLFKIELLSFKLKKIFKILFY
ncbi:MAG: hypothetical protein JWM09_115 [Francisellaceae bacterium]|nr:hypothetical protein [Francisellaceae bacterium]